MANRKALAAAVVAGLIGAGSAQGALVGQWIGDNYTTGNWADSSGNGNTLVNGAFTGPNYLASPSPHLAFNSGASQAMVRSPLTSGTISQPNTVIAVYDTARLIDNSGSNRQIIGSLTTNFQAYAGSVIDSAGSGHLQDSNRDF